MSVYRFCSRGCHANRTRAAALGPRTYRRNYPDRSKSGTTRDRLSKGLLHRAGSDLPNQNVRTNQQTIVRIDLGEQLATAAWDETPRFFSIWKRSRLDHECNTQHTSRKRNRAGIREARLQQSCRESKCALAGCGNSGRSRFAPVSLKNFAVSNYTCDLTSERAMKSEKEFLFCPPAVHL